MLHEETVEKGTLALIKEFSADTQLKHFVLVGGTALALQIGHRRSVDIDLFSTEWFDPEQLAKHVTSKYQPEVLKSGFEGTFSYIDGVKIDMINHPVPWLNQPKETEGIRMASLEDIAAMKMHAIELSEGARLRDFVDLYFLLEKFPMQTVLQAYHAKYREFGTKAAAQAVLCKYPIPQTVLN